MTCDNYELDDNGFPAPSETGVPVIDGLEMFPYVDDYCNVGVGYNDMIIPTTDCVQKIMRTWTIFEWWCS